MARAIQVGDQAPDFTLPSQTGEQVRLQDRLGERVVVLYFYPKDNTSGCTAEACAFRDSHEAFTGAGADVIGVSSDSADRHAGFAGQHRLPFTLLADQGGRVRKAYGVPAVMGFIPGRVTYVIDRTGTVRHVFRSMTNIDGHVSEALAVVRQLQAEQPALPGLLGQHLALAARRLDLPGHLREAGGPGRQQRRHVHDRKSAERVIISHSSIVPAPARLGVRMMSGGADNEEVDNFRTRIGAAIFERVAGPQGRDRRQQIHQAAGERWFAEDRPVRRVNGDSSMFIGGIRALLLQSLHPLAMAAVAEHSDYRGDPWGRLQRTSYFLAVTTFGRADDARAAIARVGAVHERVTGTAPDGRPYAASDPHLLTWVHIAEADSFLRAHSRFGIRPLDQAGRDGYVADMARIGAELGVPDPPRTEAELADRIARYRPELAATAQAREAARFLLVNPPLPAVARAPYGVLAAAAVSLLPGWARRPLLLPRLPVTETVLVRPAGHAMVRAIRWATSAPPSARAS